MHLLQLEFFKLELELQALRNLSNVDGSLFPILKFEPVKMFRNIDIFVHLLANEIISRYK
jgi:hypothetical protein